MLDCSIYLCISFTAIQILLRNFLIKFYSNFNLNIQIKTFCYTKKIWMDIYINIYMNKGIPPGQSVMRRGWTEKRFYANVKSVLHHQRADLIEFCPRQSRKKLNQSSPHQCGPVNCWSKDVEG
jgi:hypothetical protein